MEDILEKSPSFQKLLAAMSELKSEEEAGKFLRDLCTVSELKAMAERFEVAGQVDEGIPYRKINADTGVSTATITRVAHWLHHGMGGYRMILDRLKG